MSDALDRVADCFDPPDPNPDPYTFPLPVPPGHFLADYIAYGAERTDAAHEYHEAAGLTLLSAATPGVKAQLKHASKLGTNLYTLLIGKSTLSRKSTAKECARELHDAALGGASLADLSTPEAFLEQLALHSGRVSTWWVDEMTELLEKLAHAKYMSGLRSALLQLYDGRDHEYRRHTKRGKGGEREADVDWIRDPHLVLLGLATPSIFETLTLADITSGFLPRYAVSMPTGKPRRRPFAAAPAALWVQRDGLAHRLATLWLWGKTARPATFAPVALRRLDDYGAAMEHAAADLDEAARTMLARMDTRLFKLAMLIAGGWPGVEEAEGLTVTPRDADAAIAITDRFRADAITFAGRIGESDFERSVSRCRTLVRAKRRVPRRTIAQLAHLEKAVLDRVAATLVDRGQLRVEAGQHGGRGEEQAPVVWVSTEEAEA
jgi:hypothetical protein